AYVFKYQTDQDTVVKRAGGNWFSYILREHYGLFFQVAIISAVLSMLALAVPLFSMAVYDKVIAGESFSMLGQFLLGMLIVLAGTILLQRIQARMFIQVGSQV